MISIVGLLKNRLEEILAILFFSMLIVFSALRGAPVLEPLVNSGLTKKTLLYAAFVVLLLTIVRVYWKKGRWNDGLVMIKAFAPFVLALLAYESMKHLHASALTILLGIQPKDGLFAVLDNAFFGKAPYLWFHQWGLDGRGFISVMLFFYGLYYIIPVVVMSWFMIFGNMEQFRLVRRGVVIGLYGGYCSYVLIPVIGPLAPLVKIHSLFFESLPDYQSLMHNFRYQFDCFPSLHTAIPWLIVILCHGKLPRLPMCLLIVVACGITTSTIALRVHYGVDVIGGLCWAWIVACLAKLSMPKDFLHCGTECSVPLSIGKDQEQRLFGLK